MSIRIHELENEDCVWVNSDDDPVGSKSHFTKKIPDKKERAMIALAEFFGYEPAELLNLDCCFDEQNTTIRSPSFTFRDGSETKDWSIVRVKTASGNIICDKTLQSEEEFRKFCEKYGYELLSFELGTNPLCQK